MSDAERAHKIVRGLRQAVVEVTLASPLEAVCVVEAGNLSEEVARHVEEHLVGGMEDRPERAEACSQGVVRFRQDDGRVCIRMGWVKLDHGES